jgi:hypothetical protein
MSKNQKEHIMRYSLLLNNAEPADGDIPAEAIAQMQEAFGVYGQALAAAGCWWQARFCSRWSRAPR